MRRKICDGIWGMLLGDAFEGWDLIWGRGMKEKKKSGGGDVRAGALSRAAIGIKPKTHFQLYLHSRSRWLAVLATHIPRRPKKKPLRGKKVGFAEKKLRLWGIEAIEAIDAIEGVEGIV